jgi:hypothetical protein
VPQPTTLPRAPIIQEVSTTFSFDSLQNNIMTEIAIFLGDITLLKISHATLSDANISLTSEICTPMIVSSYE